MPKAKDITGLRFGKLTALNYLYTKPYGTTGKTNRIWLCRCDCGNQVAVPLGSLTSGNTKSCGCTRIEQVEKMNESHTTHNMSGTRLYRCYQAMKKRCAKDPNWVSKGIEVCIEWKNDPQAFIAWALTHGYKDNLTLDRINVYGNYEPNNCRWITKTEQQYNKTTSHYVTINGTTKTIGEWAKLTGVSQATITKRIEHGYVGEELLVPPYALYKGNRHLPIPKMAITINGETHSVKEWAEIANVSKALIYHRIDRGWPVEALLLPKFSSYNGERVDPQKTKNDNIWRNFNECVG